MAPKPNWSRDYFIKNSNERFECNFGCGTTYRRDKVDRFQHHLLNQCKNIDLETRVKINRKVGIENEPTSKKRKVDDLVEEISPNSEFSTTFSNLIDQIYDEEQEQLDILLTRTLISGNIAENFLDNPFFKQFVAKLRPSYKLPSQNSKFFQVLVSAEFERVQNVVENATNKTDFLAISCDGWKDVKENRLINIFVHTPKSYFFNSIDITADYDNAAFICQTLSAEIEKFGPKKVVAVVTDNSENREAACELLEKRYPWIIFEGCKANELDLAAKDLCSLDFISNIIKKCIEFVKLFQKTIPKTQNSTVGNSKILQLPVLSCWSSNHTLITSIKANEECLKSAILSPNIADNAEIKKNFNTLKKLLCDDIEFWTNVKLVEELLRPLRSAISTIKASKVDVCKVYRIVDSAFQETVKVASKFEPDQMQLINKILDNHRNFCESDVVHLFKLLDPTITGQNLTLEQESIAANLLNRKIIKNPVFSGCESKIFAELAQFKARTEIYNDEHWGWKALEIGGIDSNTFWSGCFPNTFLSTIFKMLQNIPTTSAVNEQNWSIGGAIDTEVQNCVPVEIVSKIKFIKHNLILEYRDFLKTESDEEIVDQIAKDDIIIEDCT